MYPLASGANDSRKVVHRLARSTSSLAQMGAYCLNSSWWSRLTCTKHRACNQLRRQKHLKGISLDEQRGRHVMPRVACGTGCRHKAAGRRDVSAAQQANWATCTV